MIAGSAVVVAAGAGLIVVSTKTGSGVAAAFGSAFLSLGMVTLFSEFFLRTQYLEDVLELVGLEREIHQSGFIGISTEGRQDWANLYASASSVRILSINPQAWIDREWGEVLEAARRREVTVDVYLPSPHELTVYEAAAERVSVAPDVYRSNILEGCKVLEARWKSAKRAAKPLHPKSSLRIDFVNVSPAYSLVQVDETGIILLQPTVPGSTTDDGFVMRFDLGRTQSVTTWFANRWLATDARCTGVPHYTDRQPSESAAPAGGE